MTHRAQIESWVIESCADLFFHLDFKVVWRLFHFIAVLTSH